MYLLAAKIFAPIILLAGLWWWHTSTVDKAYKSGKTEVLAQWKESDRVAVAVGDEKTKLLKSLAAKNQGTFNATLAENAKRAAVGAVALAERAATIDELRNALAAAPAAPRGDVSCPAARSDEASLRSCRAALSTGLAVAKGADRLAEAGERLLGDLAVKVTVLQDHAALVQSANK